MVKLNKNEIQLTANLYYKSRLHEVDKEWQVN